MQAIDTINFASAADSLVSLGGAFLLGAVIGLERQYRQRTAGLRTNVLVSLGAAIFVDMANRIGGHEGAVHVVAYVVSGVGFLGAGVIMREEGNVRGLNTAATLWGSAAVGACAGADLLVEAVCATGFVLAANTLLRPVVDRINRQPMDTPAVEVTNTVHLVASKSRQREALETIEEELSRMAYPPRDLSIRAFGADAVEIEAVLASTSVDGAQLDHLVNRLRSFDFVIQAFWRSSTSD